MLQGLSLVPPGAGAGWHHALILGLAAAASLPCLARGPWRGRVAAAAGLGAMALAMLVPQLLWPALAVMALAGAAALRQPGCGPGLALHRAASGLVMAAVMAALASLGSAGLCGAGGPGLLAPLPLLPDGAAALVTLALAGLVLHAGLTLALLVARLGRGAPGREWAEIGGMGLVTLAMALPAP